MWRKPKEGDEGCKATQRSRLERRSNRQCQVGRCRCFLLGKLPIPITGALLSDVLKEAGFSMEECQQARHVIFEGLDVEPDNSLFGGSITIEKATDPRGDVLLAYEMNGEPLPRCNFTWIL